MITVTSKDLGTIYIIGNKLQSNGFKIVSPIQTVWSWRHFDFVYRLKAM